jgi:branched-chain amino acid transport system substrate-binding protein
MAAVSVLTVACGGSGGSHSGPASASASGATYTIGVISDLTGPASAANKNLPAAVKAGAIAAKAEGYNIRYVIADGQSTPAGELAAARKLVNQEHVLAVVTVSSLIFAAAPYLSAHSVPVIGAAVDGGAEWNTERSMFSVYGTPDYTRVTTTAGAFFTKVGATTIGSVGYGTVPSAADSARGIAASAEAAGLKVGYLNAEYPLGSTDVGPAVLAMKNAGVDGIATEVQENTAFAMVSALRQQGVALRAPVLSSGYGDALLSAGPAAIQNAQNVYFTLNYEPVEMHTAATEKFQAALRSAGFTGEPGLPEYLAYVSFDALVTGLKGAGSTPTRESLISSLLNVTKYDAAGLYGGHTISFGMAGRGQSGGGADNCLWYLMFKGKSFTLVPGADPVCGTVIPGKKVG